jgi:putative addiction module component (TIGR02574 family)
MQPINLKLSELTVAERIQLAEDLWDSVAADTGELPLTDAQKAELELRLARPSAFPSSTTPAAAPYRAGSPTAFTSFRRPS